MSLLMPIKHREYVAFAKGHGALVNYWNILSLSRNACYSSQLVDIGIIRRLIGLRDVLPASPSSLPRFLDCCFESVSGIGL
jgi:hypothetical protein